MPIRDYNINGAASSMNKATAPHLIEDHQAEELIDFLADRIGFLRQRGGVKRALNASAANTASIAATEPLGICFAFNPQGDLRVGVVVDDTSGVDFYALSSDYTTATNIASFGAGLQCSVAFAPHLNESGGVWIGVTDSFVLSGIPKLWRGATTAPVIEPASETITTTSGSKTVTGSGTSFLTEASSGAFLFAETDDFTANGWSGFIGVVKSITNDTSLLLEEAALGVCTGRTYQLQPTRFPIQRASEGLITCTTTSTTVTGSFTKFRSQGVSNAWYIFRRRDMKFVGKVSSVTDEDSLTLAANATVAMSEEPYVAQLMTEDGIITGAFQPVTGAFITAYAGRQLFSGMTWDPIRPEFAYRVYVSDVGDAESVNYRERDGDYLTVPNFFSDVNTPLMGIKGTFSGVLLFKEKETSLLVGDSPETFATRPLYNDGLIDARTVVAYENGVVWAGRKGVNYFDGASVIDLTRDTLGDYYIRTFNDFDHVNHHAWAFVHRDHYCLSFSGTNLTFVINLLTGSVTTATNLRIRGGIQIPAAEGLSTWYVVKDNVDATKICDADNLFDESGVDNITCSGESAGPRFELRSKMYDLGDSMLKKFWKGLGMFYRATGSDVSVQLAVGLDGSFGNLTPSPNEFAAQASYGRKRVRFHKFNEYLRFKLTQEIPGSMTQFWLSDLTLFVKRQRKERF